MSERALVFDIDGTLVDSNDAHAAAWSDALAVFDIERPPALIRPLIGMGGDKLLPALTGIDADSPLGQRIAVQRAQCFRENYLEALAPFPYVRPLFERLGADGVRLAVASSAKKDELDRLVEIADVRDLIEHQTSADDVVSSKPDPDVVHATLELLGVPKDAVLMVGDTPYDVEAARRAGIDAIGFRCGGRSEGDLAGAIALYDGPASMLRNYDLRSWLRAGTRSVATR
jgi:HAD superfamily hydrolase (TIGR01549 family)